MYICVDVDSCMVWLTLRFKILDTSHKMPTQQPIMASFCIHFHFTNDPQ